MAHFPLTTEHVCAFGYLPTCVCMCADVCVCVCVCVCACPRNHCRPDWLPFVALLASIPIVALFFFDQLFSCILGQKEYV